MYGTPQGRRKYFKLDLCVAKAVYTDLFLLVWFLFFWKFVVFKSQNLFVYYYD